MKPVTIVDYDVGNLASLHNAFRYLDVPARITSDAEEVKGAEKLLLPGVGAFAPAMNKLRQLELASILRNKAETGTPFLGICLGMQLLFTTSHEQGEWSGLDLVPGKVIRFREGKKIPHMGWNKLEFVNDDLITADLPEESFVYFVHSYHCVPEEEESVVARCTYEEQFCAAVRKDNVWGLQFHPEKSQDVGLQMLRNFAEMN